MKKLKNYSAAAIFLFITFYELYAPINSSLNLYHSIKSHADTISFDKGSYYLFGGGLLFLATFLILLYGYKINHGWVAGPIKLNKRQSLFVKFYLFIALLALLSVPILPQVVSVSLSNYLENHGYTYCEKLSHQWGVFRTMIYTKNGRCK